MRASIWSGLCLLYSAAALSANELPAGWTQYLGTHYQADAWVGALRDPGGPGLGGIWPLGPRDNTQASQAERWSRFDRILAEAPTDQRIVSGVGGIGGGRNQEVVDTFLDRIHDGNGEPWKQALYQRAALYAASDRFRDQLHWQFGNEINGPRIRRNLQRWGQSRSRTFGLAPSNIEIYAEYYLAPGVETLRRASREKLGREKGLHIMLGSLANARRPSSLRWLDELLNYRLDGRAAPSLAHKRVHELVDGISIHYLLTANDRYWTEALPPLFEEWVKSGKVKRIWATEELGIKRARAGLGGAAALYVTARCLDFAARNQWTPDQWSCFFWGGDKGPQGTTGLAALRQLYAFLGPAPLRLAPERVLAVPAAEDLDLFVFDRPDGRRSIALMTPAMRSGRLPIERIRLPREPAKTPPRVQVRKYGEQGPQALRFELRPSTKGFDLIPDPDHPWQLASGETLLLEIDRPDDE